MSKELMDALDLLEREKNISRDSLFDAIFHDHSRNKGNEKIY